MNTLERIDSIIDRSFGHLIKHYDREPPEPRKKKPPVDYNRRHSTLNKAERDARKQFSGIAEITK